MSPNSIQNRLSFAMILILILHNIKWLYGTVLTIILSVHTDGDFLCMEIYSPAKVLVATPAARTPKKIKSFGQTLYNSFDRLRGIYYYYFRWCCCRHAGETAKGLRRGLKGLRRVMQGLWWELQTATPPSFPSSITPLAASNMRLRYNIMCETEADPHY